MHACVWQGFATVSLASYSAETVLREWHNVLSYRFMSLENSAGLTAQTSMAATVHDTQVCSCVNAATSLLLLCRPLFFTLARFNLLLFSISSFLHAGLCVLTVIGFDSVVYVYLWPLKPVKLVPYVVVRTVFISIVYLHVWAGYCISNQRRLWQTKLSSVLDWTTQWLTSS